MSLLYLSFLMTLETMAFPRALRLLWGHVPRGSLTAHPPRGQSPEVISGWPPSQVNGTPRLHPWEPHPCPLFHLSGSPRSQLGRVQDRHVAGGASRDPAEEWVTVTPGAVLGPGGERLVPSGIWVPRPWRRRPKGIQEAPTAGWGWAPPLSRHPGSLQDRPPLSDPPHLEHPGASHGQERDKVRLTPFTGQRRGPAVGTRGPRHGTVAGSHLPPFLPLCPGAAGTLGQVLGRVAMRA